MAGLVGITGASGYLGGVLVNAFGLAGWSVRRLVRAPQQPSDVRFVLGEDVDSSALTGLDVLVHAAYDLSLVTRRDIWATNVGGTERLLTAATSAGVARTIVVSSMSAYQGTRQLYGRAKLDIEDRSAAHGAIVVRPGLVIGPSSGGMGGALRRLAALPITPTVRGGQYLVREPQVAQAIVDLAAAPDAWPGQPIGLAIPVELTFGEVLRMVAREAGLRPPRLLPVPWRLLYGLIRAAEALRLPVGFRADSLLGLVRPAPGVPGLAAWDHFHLELGVTS
jgi:nucleoside-diphosphate-sugar epimerase